MDPGHLPPREQSLDLDTPLTPQQGLRDIVARELCVEELRGRLRRHVGGAGKGAYYFRRTLEACLDMLRSGPGGIMVVVVQADFASQVLFEYVDGGVLTEFWREAAKNIHLHRREFEQVLAAFCRHSENDRWDANLLQELESCLPSARDQVQEGIWNLDQQPKDGAIVLSHRGTVLCAAGHLRHPPKRFSFCRADGKGCGTRHASALGCAEAMGAIASPTRPDSGVVFVRSDAGSLHVILPGCGEAEPQILSVPTAELAAPLARQLTLQAAPGGQAAFQEEPDSEDEDEMLRLGSSRGASRARTLELVQRSKLVRAAWRKNVMHYKTGLAAGHSPVNCNDQAWSIDDMARLLDSTREPLSILAVAGVKAQQLRDFLTGRLADLRPCAGLEQMGSRIVYDASTGVQIPSWPSAFDAAVKVFRLPVPEGRAVPLGPAGLDLRAAFGLDALAAEAEDGTLDFTMLKETEVPVGGFLWVCCSRTNADGLRGFLKVGSPGGVELEDVKSGTLPLFSMKVPDAWHGRSLGALDLPRSFGIRAVGCQAVFGGISLLPGPKRILQHHERLFLAVTSPARFVAQRTCLWHILVTSRSLASLEGAAVVGGDSAESTATPEEHLGGEEESTSPSSAAGPSETEEELRREVARLHADVAALRQQLDAGSGPAGAGGWWPCACFKRDRDS